MQDTYFPLANLWQIKIPEISLIMESQNYVAEREFDNVSVKFLSFRDEGHNGLKYKMPCPK